MLQTNNVSFQAITDPKEKKAVRTARAKQGANAGGSQIIAITPLPIA